MKKFIPIEKQSKKLRREFFKSKRGSWNGLSPVTRKEENPKAYNRRKNRSTDYSEDCDFFILIIKSHCIC